MREAGQVAIMRFPTIGLAAGKPRPELFVEDALHLNRDGYVRWTVAIKSHLDTVLNGAD